MTLLNFNTLFAKDFPNMNGIKCKICEAQNTDYIAVVNCNGIGKQTL